MHPALAPEVLAAQKAELCAEAGKLRREFCDQAAKVTPVVEAAQLGLDAVRSFRQAGQLLQTARIVGNTWKILRVLDKIRGRQDESILNTIP